MPKVVGTYPLYEVVDMLNRAFFDSSPSNASYNNQVMEHTSIGTKAFALQFGASFASLTEDELSTKILGNLGVLPNAGLQAALKDYLVSVGKANVGIVAVQLGEILSGLENATGDMAVYKAAAVAWNAELNASFLYSANPANTVPSPAGPLGDFGLTLPLTAGDDAISSAQTSNWGDTILAPVSGMLSSADAIDGGLGIDTLKATLGGRCGGGAHAQERRKGAHHRRVRGPSSARPARPAWRTCGSMQRQVPPHSPGWVWPPPSVSRTPSQGAP